MDVAAGQDVVVVAEVDERHLRESAAAVGEPARLIGGPRRDQVRDGALRHDGRVAVESADLLVEIDELLGRYRAVVHQLEAVLDADVVEGPARKTRGRVL